MPPKGRDYTIGGVSQVMGRQRVAVAHEPWPMYTKHPALRGCGAQRAPSRHCKWQADGFYSLGPASTRCMGGRALSKRRNLIGNGQLKRKVTSTAGNDRNGQITCGVGLIEARNGLGEPKNAICGGSERTLGVTFSARPDTGQSVAHQTCGRASAHMCASVEESCEHVHAS